MSSLGQLSTRLDRRLQVVGELTKALLALRAELTGKLDALKLTTADVETARVADPARQLPAAAPAFVPAETTDPAEEKAEAEAGLAPLKPESEAAPAPETKPTDNRPEAAEPEPPKNVDQLPQRPGAASTPNAKLESFMVNAGVTFDAFRKWAGDTDRLENADTYASWMQLPATFCTQLLRDTRSMNKCVTRCKS